MATAKQRSKKSGVASSKAADKTASSTGSVPGTKGAASKGKSASKKAGAPARAAGQPRVATPPSGRARGKKSAPKAARAAGGGSRAGKTAKPPRRAGSAKGSSTRPTSGDAALFAPLTEGERAEALRLLTEDARTAGMANVGRYRVIAVEPLAIKAPVDLSSHRLARAVVYDYSSERSVDACIDLDTGKVIHLKTARTQPMLAHDEETTAIAIALADEQVKSKLAPGEEPQVAMHYWSHSDTSLAYTRRAAAVLFGQPGRGTSLIAVVDLLDNLVCEIVPAAEW
jgi:hypothetical protein